MTAETRGTRTRTTDRRGVRVRQDANTYRVEQVLLVEDDEPVLIREVGSFPNESRANEYAISEARRTGYERLV